VFGSVGGKVCVSLFLYRCTLDLKLY